jgi:hypothetical protein
MQVIYELQTTSNPEKLTSMFSSVANYLPGFDKVCTITGDLRPLAHAAPLITRKDGEKFIQLDFEIGVSFGGTQLQAYLRWIDKVCQLAQSTLFLVVNAYLGLHAGCPQVWAIETDSQFVGITILKHASL